MVDQWTRRGRAHVYENDLAHDGQIVPQAAISMRITEGEQAVPWLFKEYDSEFSQRVRPGDFVVAGRNFGCGKPHTTGYLGMSHLGMAVLCDSMPFVVSRALMNIGLPYLTGLEAPHRHIETGDDLEVDFATGSVRNLTRDLEMRAPALNPSVRSMIELGGVSGMLRDWLARHPELGQPWPEGEVSPVQLSQEPK